VRYKYLLHTWNSWSLFYILTVITSNFSPLEILLSSSLSICPEFIIMLWILSWKIVSFYVFVKLQPVFFLVHLICSLPRSLVIAGPVSGYVGLRRGDIKAVEVTGHSLFPVIPFTEDLIFLDLNFFISSYLVGFSVPLLNWILSS
jgi:hypothetical protein